MKFPLILAALLPLFSLAEPSVAPANVPAAKADGLPNGGIWKDDKGVHINAHGGGVLFHQGTYYWYGEHKIEGGAGNVAHVGVHVYSSTDLLKWKDEGIALKVSDDPASEIAKECVLERPKVIFNAKTGKFVMWFHLELKAKGYNAARSGVAVADTPTGPFTFLYSMRPNAKAWPLNGPNEQRQPLSAEETAFLNSLKLGGGPSADSPRAKDLVLRRDFEGGQMARDMNLFVDDDGKAYHLYAGENNSTLHISQLTDDYLKPAGRYIRIFNSDYNEAPAMMKHNGKYYLLTSGCTGWAANAARSAVADAIFGPWTKLDNPCVGFNPELKLGPEKTFGGQSTFILPIQGQPGRFVAMFDQWRPQNAIDGRYFWLPVQFTATGFKIEWQDTWNPAAPAPEAAIDVDRAMRIAARKLAAFDASQKDKTQYPTEAKGATWKTVPPQDWVSGFYPGTVWYLYEYAKAKNWPDAEAWRSRAETWTAGLEKQQFNTGTHDLGFMMFDSYGNGYRITRNPAYLPVINQAAQSLAARYLPKTRLLRSWGEITDMDRYQVIIDNMMNLELLMWAAKNGGTAKGGTSEDLRKIATSHADRALELFFRPDGGTFHVVELDPKTGDVKLKRTHQGKANDSTWSRGQTWAMYGFAYMHEATGDQRYLDASLKAADYYLAHLPADQVPPSDFNSELKGLEFKDSSAAAIAACAFFRLHRLVKDPALQKKYLDAAIASLRAITAAPYFSEGDDKASLLVYSARNYHADPNHRLTNTSLIWSDYYLLEALLQYQALKAAK